MNAVSSIISSSLVPPNLRPFMFVISTLVDALAMVMRKQVDVKHLIRLLRKSLGLNQQLYALRLTKNCFLYFYLEV